MANTNGRTAYLPRAVIKGRGPGISSGYYERGPWLLSKENRRKIEPKETPSCLIPRLLVVFTRQLEILVTTLLTRSSGSSKFVSGFPKHYIKKTPRLY